MKRFSTRMTMCFVVASIFAQVTDAAQTDFENISTVDLGDGLSAEVYNEGGVELFGLPGRSSPVVTPNGTYFREAALSPDRLTLALLVFVERADVGSDYFGCLICRRSDTSEEAKWTLQYSLLAAELNIRFDEFVNVLRIVELGNDGVAVLRIDRFSYVRPTPVRNNFEVWDLFNDRQIQDEK